MGLSAGHFVGFGLLFSALFVGGGGIFLPWVVGWLVGLVDWRCVGAIVQC